MVNIPEETRAYLAANNVKRYHLGCGTIFLKNWLNIGLWDQLEQGRLYANPNQVEGTVLLNYDLRNGIPAEKGSLDAIYHSHMLEHISFKDGLVFLQGCFDALKPGGIHRILVPDLEAFSKAYITNDSMLLDKYKEYALADEADLYQTKAAIFMGMLHNHGHLCGYDWATLEWALKRVGFTRITRKLFQESDMEDIKQMEEYSPLRALESLCVECYKP